MVASVEIIETLPLKRKVRTAITGFAGAGFIGSTALMYIARNKVFKLRAHVKSELIPPMMLIVEGRALPAFRVYSSDDAEILLVISETLIPAENSWPICLKLMEWLSGKGVKEVISIEGVPFNVPSQERIVFSYSSEERDLTGLGIRPLQEGAVSGMNACMLEECMGRGLSWTSLFVTTNRFSTIDHGGSAAAIEVLDEMFDLGVDVTPLKQMEKAQQQMMERQRRGESRGFMGRLRRRG